MTLGETIITWIALILSAILFLAISALLVLYIIDKDKFIHIIEEVKAGRLPKPEPNQPKTPIDPATRYQEFLNRIREENAEEERQQAARAAISKPVKEKQNVIHNNNKSNDGEPQQPKITHAPAKTKEPNTSGYEPVHVLTANERPNYKTLKAAADRKGYTVHVKTRLADIVTPNNDPQYMSRFGKIKSKHVDFVVYNDDMKVIAVIELDDKSHDRPDRIARDKFVDETLRACGYTVIHTRYITPDILDGL